MDWQPAPLPLKDVPFFVRPAVRRRVESIAADAGHQQVELAFYADAKARMSQAEDSVGGWSVAVQVAALQLRMGQSIRSGHVDRRQFAVVIPLQGGFPLRGGLPGGLLE